MIVSLENESGRYWRKNLVIVYCVNNKCFIVSESVLVELGNLRIKSYYLGRFAYTFILSRESILKYILIHQNIELIEISIEYRFSKLNLSMVANLNEGKQAQNQGILTRNQNLEISDWAYIHDQHLATQRKTILSYSSRYNLPI